MNEAFFVKEITVNDPVTKLPVEIALYKHEGGGLFAIDSSYITNVLNNDESIPDPLGVNKCDMVKLNEE